MTWINVKDELPEVPDLVDGEHFEPVLVTYLSFHDKKTPYCDHTAVWDGECWKWWDGGYGTEDEVKLMKRVIVEITHWMPLPMPAWRLS